MKIKNQSSTCISETALRINQDIPKDIELCMKNKLIFEPIKVNTENYVDTGNARPVAQRCRRLFGKRLEKVKEHFDDLLRR